MLRMENWSQRRFGSVVEGGLTILVSMARLGVADKNEGGKAGRHFFLK
jgi:hypothetical protein